MLVNGRAAVVTKDMRPKHNRATVKWSDTGELQKKIDADSIQSSPQPAAAGGKRKRARDEPADVLPTGCAEPAGSGPEEERVDRSPLEEILTDCQPLDGPLTKNQSVTSLDA